MVRLPRRIACCEIWFWTRGQSDMLHSEEHMQSISMKKSTRIQLSIMNTKGNLIIQKKQNSYPKPTDVCWYFLMFGTSISVIYTMWIIYRIIHSKNEEKRNRYKILTNKANDQCLMILTRITIHSGGYLIIMNMWEEGVTSPTAWS